MRYHHWLSRRYIDRNLSYSVNSYEILFNHMELLTLGTVTCFVPEQKLLQSQILATINWKKSDASEINMRRISYC